MQGLSFAKARYSMSTTEIKTCVQYDSSLSDQQHKPMDNHHSKSTQSFSPGGGKDCG